MASVSAIVRPTNWQALLVSMLIPLLVAAGLISAAVQDEWDGTPQWIYGLAALVPVEYVRALMMSILGDAFRDYRNRGYAIGQFLLSVAILAVGLILAAGYVLGVRGLVLALGEAATWKFVLPLAAILVADGLITLYFFSGDPRVQAARLEAAADDIADLLGLTLYPTPIVLLLGCALLLAMKKNGIALALAVPDLTFDRLRTLGLCYFAAYFVAKAGVLAYVQTASFNRSGERLLGGSWLTWLRGRDQDERVRNLHEEQAKAARRRTALGFDDFRG